MFPHEMNRLLGLDIPERKSSVEKILLEVKEHIENACDWFRDEINKVYDEPDLVSSDDSKIQHLMGLSRARGLLEGMLLIGEDDDDQS